MKKLIYFVSIILLLTSCVNNASRQQDSAKSENAVTHYLMANIVDSIITANPDYLNNEIKQKKVSEEVQSTLLSAIQKNHNILTEIPLSFEINGVALSTPFRVFKDIFF